MKYFILLVAFFQLSMCNAQEKLSKADKKGIELMEKSFEAYQKRDFDRSLKFV